MTILASIASSPPLKHSAIATHSPTSVIVGSVIFFKSGHGRRSRPEIAAMFAASQRFSVSVSIATIAAADGARLTISSIQRAKSSLMVASFDPKLRSINSRSAPATAAASVPSVRSAAAVVTAARPAIQSRMRPTGYHSIAGASFAAA